MKIYAHYGYRAFVLCLGYLGDMVEAALGREVHGVRLRYSA